MLIPHHLRQQHKPNSAQKYRKNSTPTPSHVHIYHYNFFFWMYMYAYKVDKYANVSVHVDVNSVTIFVMTCLYEGSHSEIEEKIA